MSALPEFRWSAQYAIEQAERVLAGEGSYERARCWLLYATTIGGFEAQAANEEQRAEFVAALAEPEGTADA